jgi:hypothetical protein
MNYKKLYLDSYSPVKKFRSLPSHTWHRFSDTPGSPASPSPVATDKLIFKFELLPSLTHNLPGTQPKRSVLEVQILLLNLIRSFSLGLDDEPIQSKDSKPTPKAEEDHCAKGPWPFFSHHRHKVSYAASSDPF